jgi:hypothetical protein
MVQYTLGGRGCTRMRPKLHLPVRMFGWRLNANLWVSVSVALKLRTETLSDWISVVKPGGVLEVYWKLQGAS